jgi:hypothetical protein
MGAVWTFLGVVVTAVINAVAAWWKGQEVENAKLDAAAAHGQLHSAEEAHKIEGQAHDAAEEPKKEDDDVGQNGGLDFTKWNAGK